MLKKFVCCLFFSSCCVAYGGQDIPQAPAAVPTLSLATPMTNVGAPVVIAQTVQQLQQGTSNFPGYVLSQQQVCTDSNCSVPGMSVASVSNDGSSRRPLLNLLKWLRDRRDTENTLDRTITWNSTRRTLRGLN